MNGNKVSTVRTKENIDHRNLFTTIFPNDYPRTLESTIIFHNFFTKINNVNVIKLK